MDEKKYFMPSVWEPDELPDGATVEINTFHWSYLGVPGGDWSQPVEHNKVTPSVTDAFIVVRVNATTGSSATCAAPRTLWESLMGLMGEGSGSSSDIFLALKAPNGNLLMANGDAALRATEKYTGGEVPLAAVFKVSRPVDGAPTAWTLWSLSNERFLRAWDDGTLRLHMEQPTSWEHFRIRQLGKVPKFFGTNLGGWLVAEQWMCPAALFEGVYDDIQDGTKVSLQSYSESKWVSAEGGGGDELHANRDSPSSWETFYLRRTATGGLQIRAGSGHFWTVKGGDTAEVVANRKEGGKRETFGVRRKVGDDTRIQLRASDGRWVRVVGGGTMLADVEDDPPDWSTNCTFIMKEESKMGGEFQLDAGLGQAEASRRLQQHRREWVTEEDFVWLAAKGVNTVRIPVGFWIAQDPTPEAPWVPGALAHLDEAFVWALRHHIRVVVCLHAVPGSQNGWEHSASRDGIAEWGQKDTPHIANTLRVIEFLASRYGGHPALIGIEPVNEPTTVGIGWDELAQYYRDSYAIVRKHAPAAFFLIAPRIFAQDSEWDDFMLGPEHTNVVFDCHWYQVHDTGTFGGKSVEWNLAFPTRQRMKALQKVERGRRLVCVGEWSLALNCQTSDETYRKFGEAQISAYGSSSAGFFFWSIKHGQGWDPWSFRTCVDSGWLDPAWWTLPRTSPWLQGQLAVTGGDGTSGGGGKAEL
eukprot:TRINITY_DN2565_c0_g1_i1.p1 TRINITY_DN2565_c0_g1~~TRINITY_DN2565_c0_g1_i1.p1  ORF type:complete len:718 (+),score=135.32 TRINITY_DN2565_c0_g1_i1:62-2155(+)